MSALLLKEVFKLNDLGVFLFAVCALFQRYKCVLAVSERSISHLQNSPRSIRLEACMETRLSGKLPGKIFSHTL